MSSEVRRLILVRHIGSSLIYFVCNAYMLASLVIWILPEWKENYQVKERDEWWSRLLKMLFVTQGFFIPLLRLTEPFFYAVATRKIKQWWAECCQRARAVKRALEI